MESQSGKSTGNLDPVDSRELRLAVTMNGGVSLAVYMGGVAHELNQLTDEKGPYRELWRFLGDPPVPVIDVLTGTSAGGINAAALALAQANANRTDLSSLRRLWIDHGQIGSLLRQPFRKTQASILAGDDYFLPQLESAFSGLTSDYKRSDRPVDLTITTTLMNPYTDRTADDLGTGIVQTHHAGSFRFQGHPSNSAIRALLRDNAPPPVDVFSDSAGETAEAGPEVQKRFEGLRTTVRALALATRASASFPVAFEACFIPIRDPQGYQDMAKYANWAKTTKKSVSRFAVDGGVLANTPTRPALEAIRHRVAGDQLVRRALLLVHPHAVRADTVRETSDEHDDPPTLLATLTGVMRAASSMGSLSYVEEIERHNEQALRWRDGRSITLSNFESLAELRHYLKSPAGEPTKSWGLFYSMRVRRGAYVLAHQIHEKCSTPLAELVRIAQDVVNDYAKDTGRTSRLPFVPDDPPCTENLSRGAWLWGLDMAVGVATFVTELLRRFHAEQAPETRAASQPAPLETLFSKTRDAWRKASNARVALETLGEKEEESATVDVTRPPRKWLTDNLHGYATRMGTTGPGTSAALVDSIVREQVIQPLLEVIGSIRHVQSLSGQHLPLVPLTNSKVLLTARSEDALLEALMMVEVIGYLVTEQDSGGDERVPSAPIELVQLSAQAKQHFAPGFTSDDKLAGMSLNRFGAFLKRSWRANDWIWGRLDAIKIILLVVLTPRVVRGLIVRYPDPEELIYRLCTATFGAQNADTEGGTHDEHVRQFIESTRGLDKHRDLAKLRAAAEEELANLSRDDDYQPLENLVSLVAYGYQMSVAAEEAPWLAKAVYDDVEEGATGSRSAAFLSRYRRWRDPKPATTLHSGDRLAANRDILEIFVESGIGQEAVEEELPGDMALRTATAAAAVATTVISSPSSGLSFAQPLTRIIRGFVGVPYWIVIGLTQRGNIARMLAASALALGVALVAVALLAPLSGFISTLVPTIGVGSLITLFAYAAARSRSVVHAAALLGLLIPLAVFALHRLTAGSHSSADSAPDKIFSFSWQESLFGTLCVLILIAGTVVVANINSPKSSPLAATGDVITAASRWWREVRGRHLLMYARRSTLGIVAILPAVWGVIALLGLTPPNAIRGILPDSVERFLAQIPHGSVVWFAAPMVIIIGHGIVIGWRKTRKLRPYGGRAGSEAHSTKTLKDPAGLAIAWSAVYGALYVTLAVTISIVRGTHPPLWEGAAAAVSLTLGWLFSVVAIHVIFWLRERRLVKRLAGAYATSLERADAVGTASFDRFTVDLLDRVGEMSTYLIKDNAKLTLTGRDVAARALAKSEVMPLSGRNARLTSNPGSTGRG
ncbi:patatin-related protein [Mycolicibacterium chubuense NBB4]|uniref:Patatin-related protein n=1 Tax=Mycolicibacterium chubuense (strain NBB4) TaxID=710421 RepID=I4BHH8_MYCCN|nr:patatin-like protein [Mycolicibacterium chubuense]AFM16735.1 patatin-related protein [Mycolicibacterium chubuense NBB4]